MSHFLFNDMWAFRLNVNRHPPIYCYWLSGEGTVGMGDPPASSTEECTCLLRDIRTCLLCDMLLIVRWRYCGYGWSSGRQYWGTYLFTLWHVIDCQVKVLWVWVILRPAVLMPRCRWLCDCFKSCCHSASLHSMHTWPDSWLSPVTWRLPWGWANFLRWSITLTPSRQHRGDRAAIEL